MGVKYEVDAWLYNARLHEWRYEEVYRGQSFIKAMYMLVRAKRHGAGCVKLEWR
jgi:hypothetical protein